MKKILIASDTATHPCTSGNRQCIMQQAEVLRSIGFEVFFLLIGSQESNAESIAATEKYWGKNFFHYPLPAWQLFVMHLSKRITRQAYPDNIDFYPPAGIVGFANTLHAEYNFKGIIVNYIWQSKLAGCQGKAVQRRERMASPLLTRRAQGVAPFSLHTCHTR